MDFDSSLDSQMRRDMGTRDTRSLIFAKRDVPRIGGSFGGFIALIVCLVLIIIATCTAIFFILRNDNDRPSLSPTNSDPERANKRHKYHQHTSVPSSSYVYGEATSTPSRTWLAALGSMFSGSESGHSRGPTSSSDQGQRSKSRGGWMKAASGDEWEDDDSQPTVKKPSRINITNSSPSMSMISPGLDSPFHPPVSMAGDSYSSVPQSVSYFAGREPTPSSPLSSGPTSPVPISSAAPLRTTSPEPIRALTSTTAESPLKHIDPDRKLSVQTVQSLQSVQSNVSGVSTRTFSGGTKFIEDI